MRSNHRMTSETAVAANATWHRFLPAFVRSRLEGRHGLQAAIGNSGWLFGDKILRMGAGLLVGIWVVRYLGPTQLGMLSYAGAFGGLFGVLATLGLDSIVVRELIKQTTRRNDILGTAFALKLVGGIVALISATGCIVLLRPGETTTWLLVAITATGFIFQSFNVIDYYFQSTVQSKFTVLAANGAFVLMTIAKIVLLLTSASLIGFALIGLGEVILTSAFLVVAYYRNRKTVFDWHFDGPMAKELMTHSWTLILASLTVMIYMRIDQIMIGQILGDREVGLFAASVRLSEIWYFIPAAIASSVFPAFMKAKERGEVFYLARIQKMYDVMTWLGISVAVLTMLCAHWIVPLLYGEAYAESADVLSIQIWAGVIVCMSYVHSTWLIIENLQKYNMVYTATGALLNVAFNLVLIPAYGIRGAACATLIAQFSPNFIQLFIPKARPNLVLMLRSFLAPVRLVQHAFVRPAA